MQFYIGYDHPGVDSDASRPVTVGWLLSTPRSGVIFDKPERLRSVETNKTHAKSASRCPAVISLESRFFAIKCPFDLHLKLVRDSGGQPALRNMSGKSSPVRPDVMQEHLIVVPEEEWRYPDRPTIQILLPYIFLADEPVYATQVAPFLHYRPEPWPGTIFGGRFPINVWPRALTWAFEWHDPSRELILKRGEPLFYVNFETEPQNRAIQMVEAERTPEVLEYIEQVHGAVGYVNQTFSLFQKAEERRPEKLVVAKKRK